MHSFIRLCSFIILILGLMPIQTANAASVVGRIAYTYGPAWVERNQTQEKISNDMIMLPNDSVITGERGRVKIIMGDGSKVYVGAQSRISLRQYTMRNNNLISGTFNMLWGKARFFVNKLTSSDASFSVRTSTAVLGVRGTEFSVWVPPTPELLSRAFEPLRLEDLPPLPTRTILISGAVFVDPGTGQQFQLTPGNTLRVDQQRRVTIRPTAQQDLNDGEQPNNPSTPTSALNSSTKPTKQNPIAPRVDMPTVDTQITNNAIQTLNATSDVKISPNFVKP